MERNNGSHYIIIGYTWVLNMELLLLWLDQFKLTYATYRRQIRQACFQGNNAFGEMSS